MEEILVPLGLKEKKRLVVFNKIDKINGSFLKNIEDRYRAVSISSLKKITTLFQWEADRTRNALERMVKSGILLDDIIVEGNSEPQYCLKSIIDSLT